MTRDAIDPEPPGQDFPQRADASGQYDGGDSYEEGSQVRPVVPLEKKGEIVHSIVPDCAARPSLGFVLDQQP